MGWVVARGPPRIAELLEDSLFEGRRSSMFDLLVANALGPTQIDQGRLTMSVGPQISLGDLT